MNNKPRKEMMMMMMDGGEYSHPATSMEAAASDCFATFNNNNNNKSTANQRRFSDNQIKSLETVFESESKLEPRKKMQVACELGLQPRQVAIWFQNKRARWKSKQLEHDYSVLRADYNTLASKYESLKKEKQNLAIQLQKLNDMKHHHRSNQKSQDGEQAVAENSRDQSDVGNDEGSVFAMKARPMLESLEHHGMNVLSDDESMNAEYLGLNVEPELLNNMVEPEGSSLTSPENWGSVDQSGSSYELWDFWS